MHHFQYKNDELYCESVRVAEIAGKVGTPFYLYSRATLKRHFEAFDGAFDGMDRLVCFSAKANTNLALLSLFAKMGGGLDIVSGGELYRGLKAGFAPERIVYSGVGKKIDEIDYAIDSGILMFNVESLEELETIDTRARELNRKAPVALRVNPDVDPKTHPYISTGLKKNKFGIERENALEAYKAARKMANVEIVGIDCHIGSQITQTSPFEDALSRLKVLADDLKALGMEIEYLDMGGGLGITYSNESPPHPTEYAAALIESLKDTRLKLVLEPGRVIVGNAGILVTRVLYRKTGLIKEFVIVDAGMNDLMRPTLYGAYHGLQPVAKKADRSAIRADVVGPICESGDFLAADREMPDIKRGELLAVMSAGAYGFTMSSNYCSRPRVAEVMVDGDRFEIVRERETYEDLVRGERVPDFI
jgi:diaminopimelate decarboxylase